MIMNFSVLTPDRVLDAVEAALQQRCSGIIPVPYPATSTASMLLLGRREDCPEELDQLLEGYETFRTFDRRTLALIEPLRAMHMTYYLVWCAQQDQDVSFLHNNPSWGSPAFWAKELNELEDQLRVIQGKTDAD